MSFDDIFIIWNVTIRHCHRPPPRDRQGKRRGQTHERQSRVAVAPPHLWLQGRIALLVASFEGTEPQHDVDRGLGGDGAVVSMGTASLTCTMASEAPDRCHLPPWELIDLPREDESPRVSSEEEAQLDERFSQWVARLLHGRIVAERGGDG